MRGHDWPTKPVSRKKEDVIGMLRAYGRDIAGALQIWDPADPTEPRHPGIEALDDDGVEQMLRDVTISPLGNKPNRGKTSLNGVQNKIVLVQTGDGWARALDGYPSTHIVKPIVAEFPSMIFDEEYASRFARGLGLAGDHKHETYGGRGLRDIARAAGGADRRELLRMTTLSVAVGNLDMHAKNVSLLHFADGSTRLAPMYDVVPRAHYDNDGEMAFRIDGEFEHRLISRNHIVSEGRSWGVQTAEDLVDGTLAEVRRIAPEERPHAGAHPSLQADITRFASNLIEGRAAADSGEGSFEPGREGRQRPGGGWTWANSIPPSEQ